MNNATEFQIEDLPSLGWIQMDYLGEENFYFTLADGSAGFIKLPFPF